jgi:pantetheine-phosphate adenylyltransferase
MKIAVYAGTFDPITNGHVDIALRASCLFDQIIIAVARDNNKNTLFDINERCALVEESIKGHDNITIETFSGLLVDFCKQKGATSIIRGLRAISDFDMEFQLALLNRGLNGGIETVFLMSDAKSLFISSSLIRNSAELGGDIRDMAPPSVVKALLGKFKDKKTPPTDLILNE